MPTYVDPSRAKGYDVEAGYDPDYIPKSGVSAPGRQGNYLPGQTNQRNEQWDGTEGDRQFRAMDLMTDQGSVARGRGHATGANSKAPSRRNSAAWEAREERNKSRRGTENTQSKYGSKIGPNGLTHDEVTLPHSSAASGTVDALGPGRRRSSSFGGDGTWIRFRSLCSSLLGARRS